MWLRVHGVVPGACGGKPERVRSRPVCWAAGAQQQPGLAAALLLAVMVSSASSPCALLQQPA